MQPIISNFDNNVSLIKHATPILTEGHNGWIEMEHGDFKQTYVPGTAIHDSVRWTGLDRVQERFMDSTLFVVDGKIIDYRTKGYNGVIHSDDTIRNLIKHVGTTIHGQMLRSNKTPIEVELAKQLIGQGGEFNIHVDFSWSPFMHHLKSLVSTMRLICQNGATVQHTLLSNQVPVINDWERHLHIAGQVLSNRTTKLLDNRMAEMHSTPANMLMVNRLRAHAHARKEEDQSLRSMECLNAIIDLTDISKYSDIDQTLSESLSSNYASRCNSHLSQYTVFNLATEMSSHTNASESSSERAIKVLYNQVLFCEDQTLNHNTHNIRSLMVDPQLALAHHMM